MNEKEELRLAIDTLEEHKAEDVTSIGVQSFSPFYDFVVIATCPNPRALGAISDHLEEAFESNGIRVTVKEGEVDSGWLIIQGEAVIVHLMLEGNRRALNLEEFLEKSVVKKKDAKDN